MAVKAVWEAVGISVVVYVWFKINQQQMAQKY